MLSDRNYMRGDYQRPGTTVLTWLLCALGSAYLLQLLFSWLGNNSIEHLFALTPHAVALGKVWTLFTYALLHANILHLLANGLGLYLIGRELLPLLGANRFGGLVLASVLVGAAAWLGVHALRGAGTPLMGASAATFALFIVFACIYPEREITFLVFFVLPVRVQPRVVAWLAVGLSLAGLAFNELAGDRFDIAHSAHLGGILTGWLYFRYFHARHGWDRAPGPVLELPAWLKRKKTEQNAIGCKVSLTPPGDLKAEVDRILDKINFAGFGALTDEEKRLLDEAKDLLSRH
jgi:membrane associated rhomboid family serine protease